MLARCDHVAHFPLDADAEVVADRHKEPQECVVVQEVEVLVLLVLVTQGNVFGRVEQPALGKVHHVVDPAGVTLQA